MLLLSRWVTELCARAEECVTLYPDPVEPEPGTLGLVHSEAGGWCRALVLGYVGQDLVKVIYVVQDLVKVIYVGQDLVKVIYVGQDQ